MKKTRLIIAPSEGHAESYCKKNGFFLRSIDSPDQFKGPGLFYVRNAEDLEGWPIDVEIRFMDSGGYSGKYVDGVLWGLRSGGFTNVTIIPMGVYPL